LIWFFNFYFFFSWKFVIPLVVVQINVQWWSLHKMGFI
jgi:hypothetical protein